MSVPPPCGVQVLPPSYGFVVTADNRAVAMDPDDPRRSLEGAEHEHDPAVLTEMGDRLDTAAGPVEMGDAMRVDDRELTVVALR